MNLRFKANRSSLESEIKADVMSYLRAIPGCYPRIIQIGVIPGRSNASKGLPDVWVVIRGTTFWIEIKRSKGRVSKEQQEFINNATRCGANVLVARSLRDVILYVSAILEKTR